MIKPSEFIVDGWVSGVSGRFTAVGRCGDEPIPVNHHFDRLIRYRHRDYPDQLGDEPVREEERPVSLRVECIHAYERSLEELGPGMTGSLVLVGNGLQDVAPGWVLGMHDSQAAEGGD